MILWRRLRRKLPVRMARTSQRKFSLSQAWLGRSQASCVAKNEKAFTLLEIIIVIAIIAASYVYVAPNLNINIETEIADSISQLNTDVRAAFDTTVLTNKVHRLVFHLKDGSYWLEYTDSRDFFIGQKEQDTDDKETLEDRQRIFDDDFQKYMDLAGEEIQDPDSDNPIPPVSPLLKAKKKLMAPTWNKVDTLEWSRRKLTESLLITSIHIEHHERPVTLEEDEENPIAFLYMFPQGFMEKAVFRIYRRLEGLQPDQSFEPYTILTRPFLGENVMFVGDKEVDFENYTDAIGTNDGH